MAIAVLPLLRSEDEVIMSDQKSNKNVSEDTAIWWKWGGQWRVPLIFGFKPPNKGLAIDRENKAILIFRINPDEKVGFGDRWDPHSIQSYVGAIEFTDDEAIDTFIHALRILKGEVNE